MKIGAAFGTSGREIHPHFYRHPKPARHRVYQCVFGWALFVASVCGAGLMTICEVLGLWLLVSFAAGAVVGRGLARLG
jgi:hypothetical protein